MLCITYVMHQCGLCDLSWACSVECTGRVVPSCVRFPCFAGAFGPTHPSRCPCARRRRLNLLERVSADAVTTILHRMIEERMEQRCRGEYERSFLSEFQEVRQLWGHGESCLGDVQLLLVFSSSG